MPPQAGPQSLHPHTSVFWGIYARICNRLATNCYSILSNLAQVFYGIWWGLELVHQPQAGLPGCTTWQTHCPYSADWKLTVILRIQMGSEKKIAECTSHHLFTSQIYPMVQVCTVLIQEIALEVIIPLCISIDSILSVIAGLWKCCARMAWHLHQKVHYPGSCATYLEVQNYFAESKTGCHRCRPKSVYECICNTMNTLTISRERRSWYQSLWGRLYAVTGSPACASMCTPASQPPPPLRRWQISASTAALTWGVAFGAPAFPFMYLKHMSVRAESSVLCAHHNCWYWWQTSYKWTEDHREEPMVQMLSFTRNLQKCCNAVPVLMGEV